VVRLSKKVEYGLIALQHMAAARTAPAVTARELADRYGIPYDLLAKVLQLLARAGVIISTQGVRGGYALARDPAEIPVSHIIRVIEGTAPAITQCISEGPESCGVFSVCTIKSPLLKVQANIERAFDSMTLAEIV
jgi:Rrf2 family protein